MSKNEQNNTPKLQRNTTNFMPTSNSKAIINGKNRKFINYNLISL